MNFKKLTSIIAISAVFGLVACDDTTSAKTDSDEDVPASSSSVEPASSADVEESSSSEEAATDATQSSSSNDIDDVVVTKPSSSSVAEDKPNSSSSNTPSIIDTTGLSDVLEEFSKLPDCTKANEGAKNSIKIQGEDITVICTDGEWEPDMSCSEGETKELMGMEVICKDGEWAPAPCKDGDTKQTEIMGMKMDLVCVDSEWVDAPCKDGDTKDMMGMTMICKDGEWEMDMSSFPDFGEGFPVLDGGFDIGQ